MRVGDLIEKLAQVKSEVGNVEVEYDINSALDHETEINEIAFNADEEKIILSSY